MPALPLSLTRPVAVPVPPRPSFLRLWWRRARDRRVLAELTRAQMRDTGLDPEAVRQESRKPFWRG